MTITLDQDVEQVWMNFWERSLCPDGELDLDAIKCELYDFHICMEEVSKVYDHCTYGAVSKLTTKAEIVIALIEENYA